MDIDGLADILDGLPCAVFVIDKRRRIVVGNRAAGELFGEALQGQDFVWAVRHPDCLAAIEKVLSGAEKSQTVVSLSLPVPTTYEMSVARTTTMAKGPLAVVSFNDISHVIEAEQMRSDFVANVSHELRSPLTALTGFIETLKGAAKNDTQAREKFLDVMQREASRMTRLISDLLSLSKVETNARVRPTGFVDVNAVVAQVIATLAPQLKKEGKVVRFDTPTSPHLVTGDEDELFQVFQNLVENAVKYGGPATQVTVQVSQHQQVAGNLGEAVAIGIQDQGPGIAPHHISRLTERFYRVDSGRSREKGGTGLGLAIVKHILNRHRGRLQVKSKLGKGSTFTVLLPMSADQS